MTIGDKIQKRKRLDAQLQEQKKKLEQERVKLLAINEELSAVEQDIEETKKPLTFDGKTLEGALRYFHALAKKYGYYLDEEETDIQALGNFEKNAPELASLKWWSNDRIVIPLEIVKTTFEKMTGGKIYLDLYK